MKSIILNIGLFLLFTINPGFTQEFSSLGTIFDFEVGDEFHIKKFNCCNDVFFEIEEITIIDKNYLNDGLYYIRKLNCYNFVNAESPILIDTGYSNLIDTLLIGFPDSVIFHPGDEVFRDIDIYNGRKICIQHTTFMGKPFLYKYVDGCGLAVTTCIVLPDSICRNADSLIYFKKGDEEWGETILSNRENISKEAPASVFPNPFSDFLIIDFQGLSHENHIRILNYAGIEERNTIIKPPQRYSRLDLADLKKGVYLLQISNKDQLWFYPIIKI
jgi:hypothetical protein